MAFLNAGLAPSKHPPFLILALPSLINSKIVEKRGEKKNLKKRLASLYSAPTRLQTTQYVRTPSPSSTGVTDTDRLKTILFIVLGLLVDLIIIIIRMRLVIKFWYRRKYKPPASGKKTICTRLQFRTEQLVVWKAHGKQVVAFTSKFNLLGNPSTRGKQKCPCSHYLLQKPCRQQLA